MFTSKLATLKKDLHDSLQGVLGGYATSVYGVEGLLNMTQEGWDNKLRDDDLMYYLGDQGYTLHGKHAREVTVIDFADDLSAIGNGFKGDQEQADLFLHTVSDEFVHGPDIYLPFPDTLLSVGNIVSGTYPYQEDVIIRIQDVTPEYKHNKHLKRAVTVSMFSKRSKMETVATGQVRDDGTRYYAPLMFPIRMDVHKDGTRVHAHPSNYTSFQAKYLFPTLPNEEVQDWNSTFGSLAFYILGAFTFLYKHQRIEYREIDPPDGLQKKRRKRNLLPYERYYVSTLGNFTKTTYTESRPSADPEHGVAMHIKKGHWRRKWGHCKLPEDQQEIEWRDAVVAGDPKYGIIVRDYEAHLLEDIE